ncbi:MAG: OmpA family protein [Porticoccaceae bacterium]|jgi:peptidoglycan-associated lipoprotein|nr:OmpA family protein [Porticoccaceae bacterium]
MNITANKLGLSILCLSALLAGCSSAPVDETTSTIEDTTVQTASLEKEMEAEKAAAMAEAQAQAQAAAVNSADTVFYFAFDKAVLSDDSRAALVENAQFLMSNPRAVRLEGHADERGTREYNMALGERRANAVKDFMIMQGVSGSMIEVISYGEEQAASFGSSAAAWSMNRRVELK